MLSDLAYSWRIYRVLRSIVKQRVVMALQPGNCWVIEHAVLDDRETDALLKTCFTRGWIEPLKDAAPKGTLEPDGSLPNGERIQSIGPLWKLTDSGRTAINRNHQIAVRGLFLSLLGVILAVAP